MPAEEYLVSYGSSGEFGRFRADAALVAQRGDRVVVRSHRGVELGVLLCPATPGHARFLPNTTLGHLLRLASAEDEERATSRRRQAQQLFLDSRTLAAELHLPLEIVDVEMLLDGEQAILHHLPWGEFDERDLVSALTRRHDLRVRLHSLRSAATLDEPEEEHGCGRDGCGRATGGGCSTGSCSTGGCSSCGAGQPADLKAYFAGLRKQMHRDQQRTPLL